MFFCFLGVLVLDGALQVDQVLTWAVEGGGCPGANGTPSLPSVHDGHNDGGRKALRMEKKALMPASIAIVFLWAHRIAQSLSRPVWPLLGASHWDHTKVLEGSRNKGFGGEYIRAVK